MKKVAEICLPRLQLISDKLEENFVVLISSLVLILTQAYSKT